MRKMGSCGEATFLLRIFLPHFYFPELSPAYSRHYVHPGTQGFAFTTAHSFCPTVQGILQGLVGDGEGQESGSWGQGFSLHPLGNQEAGHQLNRP